MGLLDYSCTSDSVKWKGEVARWMVISSLNWSVKMLIPCKADKPCGFKALVLGCVKPACEGGWLCWGYWTETLKTQEKIFVWSSSWEKDENQLWHRQGIFFITRLCENVMNWANISICSLEQLGPGFLLNNNLIWRCSVFFSRVTWPEEEEELLNREACSCCCVNKWLVGQVWRRRAKV